VHRSSINCYSAFRRLAFRSVLLILGLHLSVGAQAPPGKLDYTKSCYAAGCHDGTLKHKNLHPEVAKKKCATCHKQVAGQTHKFEAIKTPDLCVTCHKDFQFLATLKDAPPQQTDCLLCHKLHGSEHKNRLSATVPNLCYRCHPALKKGVEEDLYNHGKVTTKCLSCHDIHGKKMLPHRLKAKVTDLCMDCHTPIKKIVASAQNDHKAITLDDSCTNCHLGHSSDLKHLLKAEPKTLCLNCHDQEIKKGEKTVKNIADQLEKNPIHHSPIKDGNCSGCHSDAHGGNNPFRLKKKMPEAFYVKSTDDQFGLCFLCHERNLLNPKTPNATAFRNGDKNMHSVHVTRKKNSRNCRVCHEHHASKQSMLVTDSFEFGPKKWKVKLKYTQTTNGGTCSPACHKAFTYDRKKAVLNLPPLSPKKVTP
jgi:predicted CXXCH cytochrome family protein